MLAIAAQEPSKIELGTGIALAFTKSPVATAYTAWDLQRMSGGRLVLGLGSQVKGHVTRRFGMPWTKPAQRMKDYVGAMRACWNTLADRRAARLSQRTLQPLADDAEFRAAAGEHPHIPVMIAAVQERMLQVAGEVCDGVRLHGIVHAPLSRRDRVSQLEEGFREVRTAGRPSGRISRFRAAGFCAPRPTTIRWRTRSRR